VRTAHEADALEVCMGRHSHTTIYVSSYYFIYVLTQGRDVIHAVKLPPLSRPEATAGTLFTCFTGTNVRILTPEALQRCMLLSESMGGTYLSTPSRSLCASLKKRAAIPDTSAPWYVSKFTGTEVQNLYFCTSKASILTQFVRRREIRHRLTSLPCEYKSTNTDTICGRRN